MKYKELDNLNCSKNDEANSKKSINTTQYLTLEYESCGSSLPDDFIGSPKNQEKNANEIDFEIIDHHISTDPQISEYIFLENLQENLTEKENCHIDTSKID